MVNSIWMLQGNEGRKVVLLIETVLSSWRLSVCVALDCGPDQTGQG